MKCWLLLFALPLIAQFSENERALGKQLRQNTLANAKPISVPTSVAYLNKLASNFDPRLEFELANVQASEPEPLPGGKILVPVEAFSKATSAEEFLKLMAHAAGHVMLRHGVVSKGPDKATIYVRVTATVFPGGFKDKLAQWEQEANEFATDFMSKTQLTQADSEAFLEAKSEAQAALKAQESAVPQAPSLVRKPLRSPRI